jgi:hypothetical protein
MSTTTGGPVGFWWSELTHSYFLPSEMGYELDVSCGKRPPATTWAISLSARPIAFDWREMSARGKTFPVDKAYGVTILDLIVYILIVS